MLQGTIDDANATVVLEGFGASQRGPNFSFPVILQPGPNDFTLTAIDAAGNRASQTRTLIRASGLTLTVLTPAVGAAIAGNAVLVTATVAGGNNPGVSVNGVAAVAVGDRYHAYVPLQAGANELTVVATSLDGTSEQKVITVTATGTSVVDVTADSTKGIGPLTVTFTATSSGVIQNITADFDGNGTVDLSTTSTATPLTYTYTQPGLYLARFVVRATVGATTSDYTQIVPIAVVDRAQLDQQLKALWQGFVVTLAAQDKTAAMQYLTYSSQTRYGVVFDALPAALPRIASSLSAAQTERLGIGYSEYFVTRPTLNGESRVYLIYFIQGTDGAWRIEL